MNSDPYDSAAWKSFGMLDADESAMFEEAMRSDPALRKYSLEMDRLSAAIAAGAAAPVDPGSGLLDGIQGRLRHRPSRGAGAWFAVTGWAVALALGFVLWFGRDYSGDSAAEKPVVIRESASRPEIEPPSKAVTQRLTQEIEVLRENLEKFQRRDRALFAATPGIALPIVMTMTPPGVPAEGSPVTALLGDETRNPTLAVAEDESLDLLEETADFPESPPAQPSAMPIYDSARDLGTLVVSNLPDAGLGHGYNLWVVTENGGAPIYVGSLPESSASGAESFDFSLGSTMVLPSGFILTRDILDSPVSPSDENIVLQGPPSSAR
jgi:hypothetical protein